MKTSRYLREAQPCKEPDEAHPELKQNFISKNLKSLGFTKKQILHTGVQFASMRRTLFNGSERQTYPEHIVAGVKKVTENPDKLTEQGTNDPYAFVEFSDHNMAA
ncbi:hypothetical protein ANCCAN_07662 [Ancylostoma caninum]|uniref:Uncharacterized protein n=1 Tax=Ancylostoma caninum TaxID=29170 RepID=A0A368GTT4_ANCCA|nr:hypothetical protein ANCCAN_07662 [Ancylostoma caninum]